MAGYWPKVFLCVFMDQDGVKFHKLTKKEQGLYPAILTEQTWSIKDFLYGFRDILFLQDTAGRMDSSILPARVANHSTGFGSSCLLTELAIK